MSNLTFLEDPAFDHTQISQPVGMKSIIREIFFIIAEIINLFICACSAGASVFLVCVYLKFGTIRRKSSVFLLHYAMGCCVDLLLFPLANVLANQLVNEEAYWSLLCIVYTTSENTYILVFVFGTALGVYWFVEKFQRRWLRKVPRFRIWLTGICYVVFVVKVVVNVVQCLVTVWLGTSHVVVAICCSLMIVLIVVDVVVYKSRPLTKSQAKTKYQLDVSNYVVFSYVPLLLCSYIQFAFRIHNMFALFLDVLFRFAQFLAHSGPIVVVYWLGQNNKYFKAAYGSLFKRSTTRYDENDMGRHFKYNVTDNVVPIVTNDNEFTNSSAYAIII
ncbi:hypothetical protein Zmor_025170 [Zophobas morio]|uniref:Uncharacterized protein n=1 Tax=Zophobas morio TaxID=2755281 RepID=A0AA38HRN6_9CUCU|nr:hypothetical protein Zmor_025170 [Zophobas morio]